MPGGVEEAPGARGEHAELQLVEERPEEDLPALRLRPYQELAAEGDDEHVAQDLISPGSPITKGGKKLKLYHS